MRGFLSLQDADAIAAELAPFDRPGFLHVVLGILRHPTATLEELYEHPVQGYAALLAAAGGCYWLLNLAVAWAPGRTIPMGLLLATVAVAGPFAGVGYLYALTILIDWACDILGGRPRRRRLRMLLACAGCPGILALMVSGIPRVIVFRESLFLPDRAWLSGAPALVWGFWFADACAFAWSMLLVVRGLKIMNGFTTPRALVAVVLPLAPMALIGILFVVMIWLITAFSPPVF